MNITNIKSRQIAMAFTGSFLGAGFMSGQELMQFFAVFGSIGLMGMALAVLLFFMLGIFVMKVARRTGHIEFDKIIVERDRPWLRGFFAGVFIFFLLSIVVVMTAGAGALFNQVFGLPTIAGNVFMVICLTVVALRGVKGVLAAFGITVPLLIAAAVVTGLLSLFTFEGAGMVSRPFSGDNPLLANWLLAAIAFSSYNMMAAIAILVPIATGVKEEKTINRGILQGSVQLVFAFVCILLPLILNQAMLADSNLPMLTLAETIHPTLGIAYAVLLSCGMFGSALSCLFGVTVRLKKIRDIKERALIPGLAVLVFFGSIAGFKELIALLFPICGYIGFFAMAGISLHYLSLQKQIKGRHASRSRPSS